MSKKILDEFIAFAKKEYGITVRAVKSDTPDTVEKYFGGFLLSNSKSPVFSPCNYANKIADYSRIDMDIAFNNSLKNDNVA